MTDWNSILIDGYLDEFNRRLAWSETFRRHSERFLHTLDQNASKLPIPQQAVLLDMALRALADSERNRRIAERMVKAVENLKKKD